jgi:hypothetical protein
MSHRVVKYLLVFTNITAANGTATSVHKDGESIGADAPLMIVGAKSIAIQSDALTDTNHTADDFDVNVIASCDDADTFDDGTTDIYTSKNFTAVDLIGTLLVTPGPTHIKIRVDENGALRADLRVRAVITFDD